MTHTFVSNRTCLSLSQWGTHKANHNQSTWCAWPTSMRAVRQAWPCNLKCIWSSLLHSPFLPVQFWPHHRPLLCPWPCGMVVPMICPTKKKKNKKQTPLRKTIHIQLYKSLTVMLQKRCLTMARPANVSAGDENRSKEENA